MLRVIGTKPDQAAVGSDPVLARLRLDDLVDVNVRQTAGYGIVHKGATVEPREAFIGADPQEIVRVAIDAADVIVRQPLVDGVRANRKLLGGSGQCQEEKRSRQSDQ